ncbi:MAG: hypothetical protein AAF518_16975, partial [Spirochaetota bacterium]
FQERYSWNENVFRDFFAGKEKRQNTLLSLEERCWNVEIADAHSCYNLGILYFFFLNRKEDSFKHFEKAVLLQPKDSLYRDMFRNAALETGKSQQIEKNYPMHTEDVYQYSLAIDFCKKGKSELALAKVRPLVEKRVIRKGNLNAGVFASCFSQAAREELLQQAAKDSMRYRAAYYQQKSKAHVFSQIWDTLYYVKKKSLLKGSKSRNSVTEAWRQVLLAVSQNDADTAQENLGKFLSSVRYYKKASVKNADLYKALEKAAYLLIEQNSFFKQHRSLLKEF